MTSLRRLWASLQTRLDAIEASLENLESLVRQRASRIYGIRLLTGIGLSGTIRVIAMTAWIAALVLVPLHYRSDLVHPSDIGSDSSNYAAAAERLAAHHGLYRLVSGDRPTPIDNPPAWEAVAILSPPAVATVDLWQLALPDTARFYPAWALGIAAMATVGLIVIAFAPLLFVLLIAYAATPLALTAWSGNVNALIFAGAAVVWWASRQESRRWQYLAGAIVAVAACVKIGPVMLGVWLLAQGRRSAAMALIVTGLVVIALTVALAGWGVLPEYLGVVRSTTGAPAPLSLPGFLGGLGAPNLLQAASIPVGLLLATIIVFTNRRSPIAFAAAVLAMVFSTTIVREESMSVALVAGIAWAPDTVRERGWLPAVGARRFLNMALIGGALLGVIAVVLSLTSGGMDRSSLAITNGRDEPVVVRLSLYAQPSTFGFLVPGHSVAYGWSGLAGASPPVLTVWTRDCGLIAFIDLPRRGGAIEVDAAGGRLTAALPGRAAFADYASDCAKEARELLADRSSGT